MAHRALGLLVLYFSFAFCFTPLLHAAPQGFKLGLGVLPINMYKTTTKASGEISATGDVYYPIVGQGRFTIFTETILAPRIAYTFLPKRSETGATDISVFLLSLPMTGNFASSQNTSWNFGIGLMRIEQKGRGGTTVLNNGSGTATFAKPDYTQTAQLFTIESGLNFILTETMDLGLDLIFTSPFTERRAMSGLFSFTYRFDTSMGGAF